MSIYVGESAKRHIPIAIDYDELTGEITWEERPDMTNFWSVTLGNGARGEANAVVLGGSHVTSLRVGDWLHLSKDERVDGGNDDEQVLVRRSWIDAVEKRLDYLEGHTLLY